MPEGPMPLPVDRLEEVVDLSNRVFRTGGGDMGCEYPLVFDPQCLEGMRVILEDGKVVSHVGVCVREASILGARLTVASIGAVCTDRDYRGRGYARALLEDATAYARGRGASLMLISGDRGLYREFGAVRPGRFTHIEVAVVDLPPGYALDKAGETDIPDLIRLYQREPVRFIRPPDDWKRLLHAGMLMNQAADLWLIRDAEDVLAYVGVQRPGGDNLPSVREYAGSREAVWSTMGALGITYGSSSVRASLMPEDGDMEGRARRAGVRMHTSGFDGTVKVIDPDAFFQAALPLWRERYGSVADSLQLTGNGSDNSTILRCASGDQAVEWAGPELTIAFFGPEKGKEEGWTGIPGIEPLPLLHYGYNYV